MPGAIGVYSNDDPGLAKLPTIMVTAPAAMTAPTLASRTLRFLGATQIEIDARELLEVQ